MAVKVFLVDEHEVVRRGVAAILKDADDIEIVGEAASIRMALTRVPATKPDIAIVGVLFDIGSGVELCRDLRSRHPPTAVLMLTASDDTTVTLAAFLAGAAGVVSKSITSGALIAAVRTVAAGSSLLDAQAAATILDRLRNPLEPTTGPFEGLSPMEHNVLDCLGEGMSNRQIGEHLFVAEKTVKNYVSRVLTKLGFTSRTQAALAVTKENATIAAEGNL